MNFDIYHYAFAQDFNQANALYREGEYGRAITEYEGIIKHGLESGNLYYNLGNAYFKNGDFSRALLNYERAKLFIADDSDLKSNYDYACFLLNLGPQDFSAGRGFGAGIDKVSANFSVDFLIIFLSLSYILTVLILLFQAYFAPLKRISKPAIALLIFLSLFLSVSFYRKVMYLKKGALIIADNAAARFEPLESATTYFTLSPGVKVEVVDVSGSWKKIKRLDAKTGWVKNGDLEMISFD